MIKIRTKIDEIETNRQKKYKELMKQKAGSLKKIRPLTNQTKMKREKIQISKITNAKGEITTNTMDIQEIIRDLFEKLYCNKFEGHEEIDKFLDTYNHLKLNQEDFNHL
jgi:hypothetical protein